MVPAVEDDDPSLLATASEGATSLSETNMHVGYPIARTPDTPNTAEVLTASCLFTTVVERFGTEIFRYCCQLAGNVTDADDLYQDTLLKAFRAFDRLPHDANHRAWLYRIASNTFISERRKNSRVQPISDGLADSLSDAQPDQARALDARELLGEVETFVQALPPKQRVALVLRKHHEYGYAQIAEVLNSSEAAARANVHEALMKLRGAFAHKMEV